MKVYGYTEISGQGVKARYEDHRIMVGKDSLSHSESIDHPKCKFDSSLAHIVVDGKYAGYITIGDEIKPDSTKAPRKLRHQGIEQILVLTGDNSWSAKAVPDKLPIDSFYAELLPEDKVGIFERLIQQNRGEGKIAFVGDGINDAPVLARADVGVAMGALGSDAAVETADIVLMNDSPLKITEAVAIAR